MKRAQEWADHLAATNAFEHSKGKLNGGCVGENIFSSSGGEGSAIDATRAWYCEVDDYYSTINKWQNTPMIGHFTQVCGNYRMSHLLAHLALGWVDLDFTSAGPEL